MKKPDQELGLGHDQWHERQQKLSTQQAIVFTVRQALETAFPTATEATLHNLTAFLVEKVHLNRFIKLMHQPATPETILKMKQELRGELRRIAFVRQIIKDPSIRAAFGLSQRQLRQHLSLSLLQFSELESDISSDILLEAATAGVTPISEFMERYPLIFIRF